MLTILYSNQYRQHTYRVLLYVWYEEASYANIVLSLQSIVSIPSNINIEVNVSLGNIDLNASNSPPDYSWTNGPYSGTITNQLLVDNTTIQFSESDMTTSFGIFNNVAKLEISITQT